MPTNRTHDPSRSDMEVQCQAQHTEEERGRARRRASRRRAFEIDPSPSVQRTLGFGQAPNLRGRAVATKEQASKEIQI